MPRSARLALTLGIVAALAGVAAAAGSRASEATRTQTMNRALVAGARHIAGPNATIEVASQHLGAGRELNPSVIITRPTGRSTTLFVYRLGGKGLVEARHLVESRGRVRVFPTESKSGLHVATRRVDGKLKMSLRYDWNKAVVELKYDAKSGEVTGGRTRRFVGKRLSPARVVLAYETLLDDEAD